MKAGWLVCLFLLLRFGFLALLDKASLARAAHFAPRKGKEVYAYDIYQLSNTVFLLALFFYRVTWTASWLIYSGLGLYLSGLLLCTLSLYAFAAPEKGLHTKGIYRYSRNPMYVSYFLIFMGCALLCRSWFLFVLVLLFQLSSHWIILSEERWCKQQFGSAYDDYAKKVRRYL